MKTVLLTLDRTEKDARAIRAAAAFAEMADADIHVIHVLGGVPGVDPSDVSESAARRHEQAREWLDATRVTVRAARGRKVTAELIVSLLPVEQVLQAAEAVDASLIVMATRSAGSIGRALLGSVADRIVRSSGRPVALVPAGMPGDSTPPTFRKALLPLDGSLEVGRIVEEVQRLAKTVSLHFVLLHVVKTELTDSYAMRAAFSVPGESRADTDTGPSSPQVPLATAELNAIADRIRVAGGVAEVQVVEGAHPDEEILRATASSGADFIAMATRRLDGVSRWLIGSVADGVTRGSSVPVLITPP